MTAADTRTHAPTQGRCPITRDGLTRWGMVAVNGFVAVTSVAGGVAMALGLEDENLGLELLAGTPFNTYLWPGIALVGTVGVSAAIATALSVRRHRWSGPASIFAGTVLTGWIGVEIALLEQPGEPTTTEVVYLTAAAVMALLGAGRARSARGQ